MRIYKCSIRYLATGYIPGSDEKEGDILVRAKNVLQAYQKALHFRSAGDVKKTLEVLSVNLEGTIDRD